MATRSEAAILCPGPSLKTHSAFEGLSLIGVNRAAFYRECDWWVFADWQMFTDYPLDYKPGLVTLKSAKDSLQKKGNDLSGYQVTTFDSMTKWCPSKLAWTLFSITAAMVFAAHTGFDELHIYGCDWIEAPDWDGHTDDRYRRTPDRWEHERAVWHDVRDWLAKQGTEVKRHGPA